LGSKIISLEEFKKELCCGDKFLGSKIISLEEFKKS